MAADKKPKIDLKARLGKKTVTTGATGSIPPPIAVGKGGVPAPPFATPSSPVAAAVAASMAPKAPEPQAIKVEMSEEVVQAQRKGKTKIVVLAAATAIVGGLIGYTLGGGVQRRIGQNRAIAGAKTLAGEVDKANGTTEQLVEVVKGALGKLGDNKYPAEEVSKLGAINIPFDGSYLYGKGVERIEGKTQRLLFQYAELCQSANDQKERLQFVLSAGKKGIEEFMSQKEEPKIRWGAIVTYGPHGLWAAMQPIPEPFVAKGKDKEGEKFEWPKEFKLKLGQNEQTFERYSKGDPMRGDPKLVMVNPETEPGVCPHDPLGELKRQIRSLRVILQGSETPGREKPGLLPVGSKLIEELKKIGKPR